MRNFELYLDESGSFIDESQSKSPSLIGGILVKKGALSQEKAQKIMEEAVSSVDDKYVHINDIAVRNKKLAGKVAINIMEKIKTIPAYIVIFENNELLDFKDDKLLYLNIMSEGITNLLEKLSLEKADTVELNVIAAVRRDLEVDDNRTIIELEEYSERIKERIYMKISEKNLFLSKNCSIDFELSSARKNQKLMIADVVCNSRLTRNSSKFNDEQREFLEKTYNNSKYIFNVFRTNTQAKLSEYLIQNNIVDAIFLLNEVDDEKTRKELVRLLIDNINTMPVINLRIQLELLSLKIRSMIDVQRNLSLCEKILLDLEQNVVKKIKVKDFIIDKLKIDISLYLLTIYTHQGNCNKAEEQIEISKKRLNTISGSRFFLEYYYILKTREAIYYNTCFRNFKTIEVLTEAIEKFEQIIETMSEIEELDTIKSDILAKSAGTRLQAYINLITPNLNQETKNEYYKKAVQDSELAIDQFISEADKRRQYQYRCMLEIAMDNVDEAIKYLMKVEDLNERNFEKFLNLVANIPDFSKNFIMSNYFEVMQHLVNEDNKELGVQMYEAYKSNESIYDEYSLEEQEDDVLFKNNKKNWIVHPFEMIFWKIGQYFKETNRDLALKYFNKAIEICEKMNEPTTIVLELAIEADKLSISKNINEDKNTIINKYNSIMQNEQLDDTQSFLETLKEDFETIELFDDVYTLKETCKKIAGEIKI